MIAIALIYISKYDQVFEQSNNNFRIWADGIGIGIESAWFNATCTFKKSKIKKKFMLGNLTTLGRFYLAVLNCWHQLQYVAQVEDNCNRLECVIERE